MKLLSVSSDAKTIKGEKKGYKTGILYLAPAKLSGHEVCASSTAGCRAACLNTAGRAGVFPAIAEARIRKTQLLFSDREAFIALLDKDIRALIAKAAREGFTPCVRLNGTSDLPWLGQLMARRFPTVQFYDYTKHARPWEREMHNYHLTFSYSGENIDAAVSALSYGINVAVVFPVRKGHVLPQKWQGYTVIDGDLSDLRFTDPRGVVVGLRAKGKAKQDTSGFVQIGATI